MKRSKRFVALLLLLAMTLTCVGCSNGEKKTESGSDKEVTGTENAVQTETKMPMTIEVAATAGGLQGFPIYIAEKMGWFQEENLDVNVTFYENGPVQVEAISTWDIATTGIGGILAGVIGYDARIIASSNTCLLYTSRCV